MSTEVKRKILIVDDEESVLNSLKRLFRNHSFEVHTENLPLRAVETARQVKFDLVISDMRMPEMDGAELLSKIREISPSTERILLTGHSDMDSTIRAINDGGIFGFVAKPWDNEQFTDLVTSALQERHNNRLKNKALHSLKRMNDNIKSEHSEVKQALADVEEHSKQKEQALSDSYSLIEEMLLNLLDMKLTGQREFAYILEELVLNVGKSVELSEEHIESLARASKLHGVGKISVPDVLLNQDFEDLNEDERHIYEGYPSQSAVTVIAVPTYAECADILFKQKEACDGSGYPLNLKKADLNLVNRVFNACLDYCEMRFASRSGLGLAHDRAVAAMLENRQRYDEKVLSLINKVSLSRDTNANTYTEIILPVHSLKSGMHVAKDIFSDNDVLLLRKGAQISEAMIEKLHQLDRRLEKRMMVRVTFDEHTEADTAS